MSVRSALAQLVARLGVDAIDLGEPSIVHVPSSGASPDLAFVGSSPWGPADTASTWLDVPVDATQPDRFLFRLASWTVPAGKAARLVGFGLYAEMGVRLDTTTGGVYPVRLPLTSPAWAFPDGNIAWSITRRRAPSDRSAVIDPYQPRGWSANPDELHSALVYVRQVDARGEPIAPTTYRAPVGFPGSPLEGLSTMRDGRAGWQHPRDTGVNVAVEGGQDIVLWASVKQTNPMTRPPLERAALGSTIDLGALGPEDRFLLAFPSAVYTRIGGYLTFEIGPSNRNAHHSLLAPGRRC